MMTPLRAAFIGTLCAALVGCDGTGIVGAANGRIGLAGGLSQTQAVVGVWRRSVFFLDDFGYSRLSETTFRLDSDGAATRVQVARNYTLGLADVLVATGRWQLNGQTLHFDFFTPSPFQLDLTARVTGDALDLAGQLFLRVVN